MKNGISLVVTILIVATVGWMLSSMLDSSQLAPGPTDPIAVGDSTSVAPPNSPRMGTTLAAGTSLTQASRAFFLHDQCLLAEKGRAFLATQRALKNGQFSPTGEPVLLQSDEENKAEADRMATTERVLNAVQAAEGNCGEFQGRLLDGSIYETALKAATAGDERAAVCYLSISYPMPDAMRNDPEQRAAFGWNARQLIANGIQRGDWQMTQLAWDAENDREMGWIRAAGAENPEDSAEIRYRLIALQMLGTTDAEAKRQLGELTTFLARTITPDRVSRGKAWAKSNFQNYFARSPPFDPSRPYCPPR